MDYTEKEIDNIKAHAFDKGWRYGLLIGVIIVLLGAAIGTFII